MRREKYLPNSQNSVYLASTSHHITYLYILFYTQAKHISYIYIEPDIDTCVGNREPKSNRKSKSGPKANHSVFFL